MSRVPATSQFVKLGMVLSTSTSRGPKEFSGSLRRSMPRPTPSFRSALRERGSLFPGMRVEYTDNLANEGSRAMCQPMTSASPAPSDLDPG